MGAHIVDGQFQSDKYPTCPPGKVPLSVKDPSAQDLLWQYAQRRRSVDPEFAADLETALRAAGYDPRYGLRLLSSRDLEDEEVRSTFRRRDLGAFVTGPHTGGVYYVRAGLDNRDYARCADLRTAVRVCEFVRGDARMGANLVRRPGMGCNGAGGTWVFGDELRLRPARRP